MSPSVEVDQEVWECLQARAEPLVDTPNSVLRKVLGLSPDGANGPHHLHRSDGKHRAGAAGESGRTPENRAPVGSLLPESEYELPLLRVLAGRGGSAPARDVVTAVGELLDGRLTALDRAELPNGGQRWQNRVQFTRLRLKERGLIKSGSPRGLWELSESGVELLNQAPAAR